MEKKSMRLYLKVTRTALVATFEDGQTNTWTLPDRDNRLAVEQLFHGAAQWARERGARDGQVDAIYKKLHGANYYINDPLKGRGGRKEYVHAEDIDI
jgi:hypothetical protein